jgi:hypothetical protein
MLRGDIVVTVYSGDKIKDYLVQKDIQKVQYELYNLSKKEDTLDSLSNLKLYFLAKTKPEAVVFECKLFQSAKEVDDYRSKPLPDYEQVVLYEILKGQEINKYNGFYGDLELAQFYGNRANGKAFKKEDIDEKAFYMLVEDSILKVDLKL